MFLKHKRKLFILIDWWKENIAVERFKYPTTVSKVEKNIEKLMNRVIESESADWYVPPSTNYVDSKYTAGSLKKEPEIDKYSDFYTFGMSLGACVLMNDWGYCYLPRDKRVILQDCSISEDIADGDIVTIDKYIKYLKDKKRNFENAELEHNNQIKKEMERYAEKGAAWVHESSYIKEPHRYEFKKEELYDPVKFKNLDEIYRTI